MQVARHGGDAVDHALVHADVDDVGAVLNLLARDADGFFELAFLDEARELRRAGDVGALADHDVDAGLLGEGLRSGEAQRLRSAYFTLKLPPRRVALREFARMHAFEGLGDGGDVLGRVAAAAAGDVDEAAVREAAERARHVVGAEIEAGRRERVGQAGVGVAGDGDVGLLGELAEEGVHEVGAERAVEADGERLHVLDGVPEGFGGLRGDEGFAAAADCCGDHDGQLFSSGCEAILIEDLADGDERGLGVERVEDGLDEQQIDAAGDERADLMRVGGLHLVEGDDAKAGIVGVGRVGERDGERADGAGDEALTAGRRWRRDRPTRGTAARRCSLMSQARSLSDASSMIFW